MPVALILQGGLLDLAYLLAVTATGVEAAPGRWVGWAGHIPGQHYALPFVLRVRDRDHGQQRLGVWVERIFEYLVLISGLGDLPEYITLTQSHMYRMVDRSWEMNM